MGKTVLVIGGGLGSLCGAIRLAKVGFKVILFEKNSFLGGKINELSINSYRFDTGPSLLTMPWIIDEIFKFTGCEREHFLEFVPVEPICRYFFPDGFVFDASSNQEEMSGEINRLSPKDKDSYNNFINYTENIYNISINHFLNTLIHEFPRLLKWRNFPALLKIYKIDPFRTVHGVVSKFFSDPRMIQLFDRYTTYVGSNPYKAPATLNVISYIENKFGGFYIKGGFYRLIEALINIASGMGIEIYTNSKVDKILYNNGSVRGIEVNGDKISGDVVLCGMDVVTAYNELISGFDKKTEILNRLEPSLSGMLFLWGINKKHPQLEHHNILFSSDYKKEFQQIFNELHPPDDPTIYISITCRKDREHAPEESENWYVLLNMPYLHEKQKWDVEKSRMKDIVLKKLKNIGIDIENEIKEEKVYTPVDFHNLFLSNKGSIYGISSNSKFTAFKRPPNRSREIEGLYFTGGSTHPGGGVPLVMLSAKIAVELIAEREGINLQKYMN